MKPTSAFLVGIAAVISSFIIGGAIGEIKALPKKISVTGSAQRVIESDAIKWQLRLSRQVELGALKEGYALIAGDLKSVDGFLAGKNIEKSEITMTPIGVEKRQIENTNDKGVAVIKDYYILSQSYTIDSGDIGKIVQAIDKSNELIQAGIAIENDGIEYFYTKLSQLKMEMLAEATRNAKERAEAISGSVDSTLGELISADMGVFQITPVNSTEVSDWGTYDTSSYDKQITAIVRAEFGIK